MDCCGGQRGVIVALLLTLKLGVWHCQEAEVFFPPVNLEIHGDSEHQRLLVEWSVSKKLYKSDSDIKFHIQVARSEKMNIIDNKISHFSRNTQSFNWTWDSELPLECDSHSARIRITIVGNVPTAEMNWSEWSPWKTHHGQNKGKTDTKIYPHERLVPLGSDVMFCCLPGAGQVVQGMMYNRSKVERALHMGTNAFVISVKNVTKTRSNGVIIVCEVDKNPHTSGTVLYVTRLPDDPEDFSCVTQDLRSLRCSWNPGDLYNFFGRLKVSYDLHEKLSGNSQSCERDHCDWTIQTNQQMYNFILTAKNQLGEKSITTIVYLNQRVLLMAPSSLIASDVSSSAITLVWSLKADYTSLQIQCQVDLQKTPASEVNMKTTGKISTKIYSVSLSGLQPYTEYELRVRCMAESSLAGWSNWSNIAVKTLEDAPAGALDVWRHIEDDDERIVTLYWKPSSLFRANGDLSHYNITFWPLEGAPVGREISVSGVNSSRISIGRQAYSISVSAHNGAGGSPPAELRIPATAASDTEPIVAERTYGKDGGIYLTWQQKPHAHGYVVEWCAAPRSPHCDLQWKKYNFTIQSDVIKSGIFTSGVRYEFRIYGSMKDGEHLLEKATGYTEERVCSIKPNVTISKLEPKSICLDWSPYPTDECREGFLIGYNVYVKDTERECKLDKSDVHIRQDDFLLCRFYIGDSHKTQFTIEDLKPNGKYEVAVVAVTGGGETPAQFLEVHTPSDAGAALRSILVPIIAVSVLALVLLFIGCWKRAWLKRICFPDIPDPNKSKIFSFNGAKGSLNRAILPTTKSEPQIVDLVSIQANRQHKTQEDADDSSEYQLQETYAKIQTGEGIKCDTDFIDDYVPCDNEKSLYPSVNGPAYKSQSLFCLEFFNETYSDTLDNNIRDSAPGYRPQTNNTLVHQSVDPESRLDDGPAICINSPGYDSEPMSPTSVDSTSFMLAD